MHKASQLEIEQGMSETFKQEMAHIRDQSNALLKLFSISGGININCRLDGDKNTIVNFIETTIQLPSKEYVPYCKAIHIEELKDKVEALYLLFKNAPKDSKRSPQAIIECIESNAKTDPRLEIVKTDIIALFTRLAVSQNILFESPDDLSEERILH